MVSQKTPRIPVVLLLEDELDADPEWSPWLRRNREAIIKQLMESEVGPVGPIKAFRWPDTWESPDDFYFRATDAFASDFWAEVLNATLELTYENLFYRNQEDVENLLAEAGEAEAERDDIVDLFDMGSRIPWEQLNAAIAESADSMVVGVSRAQAYLLASSNWNAYRESGGELNLGDPEVLAFYALEMDVGEEVTTEGFVDWLVENSSRYRIELPAALLEEE